MSRLSFQSIFVVPFYSFNVALDFSLTPKRLDNFISEKTMKSTRIRLDIPSVEPGIAAVEGQPIVNRDFGLKKLQYLSLDFFTFNSSCFDLSH